MKSLLMIPLLMAIAQAQVCVRPIHPAVTSVHVQAVVLELQKHGIPAHPCGEAFEGMEIWFFPLVFNYSSPETSYYITENSIPGGVAGTIMVGRAEYVDGSWEMSVHPNGGVWTTKRVQSGSLKSAAGSTGKWLLKNPRYTSQ